MSSRFELVGFFYQSPSRNSYTIEVTEQWNTGDKIFLSKLDREKIDRNPGLTVKLYRLKRHSKATPQLRKSSLHMKVADPSKLKLNLFEFPK